jgi:8-oxoguanine DNA glycosylase-like protein
VNPESDARELASVVLQFLEASTAHGSIVGSAEPLRRDVRIRVGTWRRWLTPDAPLDRRGYHGPLPPERAEIAGELLNDPQRRDGNELHIDRPFLAELSAHVRKEESACNLMRLWLAAMMWGSGTTNGRGPWRTYEGLRSPELPRILERTAASAAAGDVVFAYRGCDIRGSAEPFFTKWLWALGLALERRPRMLVLDRRVRGTLLHALWNSNGWKSPQGAPGYLQYLELMEDATARIASGSGLAAFDSEKLEWLLFDESSHENTEEACLSGWLANS